MKIAVKQPGKPLEIKETTEKYRMDACREFIGKNNLIEYVRLNNEGTLFLGVDESGLLKQLEPNFFVELNNPLFPIQIMVGTVVFVKTKCIDVTDEEIWNSEVEDLTDEDLELINNLLDSGHQKDLTIKYMTTRHHIKSGK